MTKYTKTEVTEARTTLLEYLQPGDTVFCSLEHVSASGMQRVIQLHLFRGDSRNPQHLVLGYNAARVLGDTFDREREGIKIRGAGMDMGFHLVYSLSSALFDGDGYALTHRWL